MIFDGMDLNDYMRAECARPLMASPSVSTTSAAGRDGFEVSGVKLESFTVDVECHVLPGWPLPLAEGIRRTSDIKRLIAKQLYRKEKRPLIFDDDPGTHCMAIVSGISDIERVGYVDYFTVTFTCDPLFFDNEETSIALVSGSNELSIGGTAPALALFEVKATASTVTVAHEDGRFVKVGTAPGATVRIDMDLKRATTNGADARVSIQSTFFELEPGERIVSVSGGSGSMMHREAWL